MKLCVCIALVVWIAWVGLGAQTPTPNPTKVEFTPSADHADPTGVVTGYELIFYLLGTQTVTHTVVLGKPTPEADGFIRRDFLPLLPTPLVPGQVYEARVWAIGPGGRTGSAVSNAFLVETTTLPGTPLTPTQMGIRIAPLVNGLTGVYYPTTDFSGVSVTRIDPEVAFSWDASPAPGIGPDAFSVRWTGSVVPQFSETYTFYTTTDDGARLWVNNVLVIDDWQEHAPTERSVTVTLPAGARVPIRLDFFEQGGGAVAQLRWSSPSTPKTIIPTTRLLPQ